MTALLFPLLMLVADTGQAANGPRVSASPFAIYSEFAINREGSATHRAPPHDRWLGEDKFKHLAFSYLITVGTFGATRLAADHDASVTVATVAGAAAGIGKEIYDARRQGPSLRDLLWDALGVAAAVLIAQETR